MSFEINRGGIFGLLGPNGAGKTTLLRLITRMLLPDSGFVFFNESNISEVHLKKIGYLPEERGLYPKMKANDHIHFLSSLKGISFKESKVELNYWAERLDIVHLLYSNI